MPGHSFANFTKWKGHTQMSSSLQLLNYISAFTYSVNIYIAFHSTASSIIYQILGIKVEETIHRTTPEPNARVLTAPFTEHQTGGCLFNLS